MAARPYEMVLHRRNKPVRDLEPFTRAADLDDTKYVNETDGLLLKWLAAAVQRSGGKLEELAEYDLHLREPGRDKTVRVFAAHPDEVKPQ